MLSREGAEGWEASLGPALKVGLPTCSESRGVSGERLCCWRTVWTLPHRSPPLLRRLGRLGLHSTDPESQCNFFQGSARAPRGRYSGKGIEDWTVVTQAGTRSSRRPLGIVAPADVSSEGVGSAAGGTARTRPRGTYFGQVRGLHEKRRLTNTIRA